MSRTRKLATYGYLATAGGVLGGAALISARLGDRTGRVWWPLSRAGSAGMTRVAGVQPLIAEGLEQLAPGRPAVVVANHRSLIDPAVLMQPSEVPLRFLVKHSVSKWPVFGRSLAAMGHIFVEKRGRDSSGRALDRAANAIRDGKTVLVFPEGTRSRTGELLPFRLGAFELAVRAQVPVVPAWIEGTGDVLPPGDGVGRAGPVALVVGEPIAPGDDPQALADRSRSVMLELAERARRLRRDRSSV